MSIHRIVIVALAALFATSALAQAPPAPPVRVHGQIEAVGDKQLTVKSRDGATLKIALNDPLTVTAVSKIDIAEIKPNSFVGISSVKGTDGRHYALEVHVFPEASRGSNEGHYPWDLKPDSMMTNATVATIATEAKGRVLTLKYKQSDQPIEITVPLDAPIVAFAPGTPDLLKVGHHIFSGTQKAADGTLSAGRVAVGVGGLVPPM
ncbi:MAG: hypothetical protein EXQ87_13495 [Alphaproteobacteria bacterium]|nr:hypothetical protein [Alphaproteobacteria bacterium]